MMIMMINMINFTALVLLYYKN